MARVPLVDTDGLRQASASSDIQPQIPLNRQRILANGPGLAEAFRELDQAHWSHLSLPGLLAATAVLAVTRRSPYEFGNFRAQAEKFGVTDDMIEAIQDEDWTDPSFSDAQKSVFRFAMMYDAGHGIPDDLFAQTSSHLDPVQIVQLASLCSVYGGFARMAIALGTDPEQ